MSVMPDLDPDMTSFVAFFNVIEQGGLPESEVTWGDVTDNSNVQWVDEYDNGLILGYANSPWGDTRVRCKTDGWCIAYNSWDGVIPEDDSGGRVVGLHELTHRPRVTDSSSTGANPPEQNRFAEAVDDITHSLSGSGAMTFSYSDVGFYDFEYGAESLSTFYHYVTQESNVTREINLLSNTDIKQCHVGGCCNTYYGNHSQVYADGIEVTNSSNVFDGDSNADAWGVYDSTQLLVDDGTLSVNIDTDSSVEAHATVGTLWSEATN